MGIANIKNQKINIFAILFDQELYFYPSKKFFYSYFRGCKLVDEKYINNGS